MRKKVFGYLRISSKSQINGDGFNRQTIAINEYAKAHNLEVIDIYKEEGVSGALLDRPELARLLVDLELNSVNTVVVEKMDRLARDIIVQETICQSLFNSETELISTLEGADMLASDPSRTLIRQIFGAVAQYDKAMLVLKLKAGRIRKRKLTGRCEGRKRYKDDHIDIVKEVKKLYRKPRKKRRLTACQIAEKMNAAGHRTASGKEFNTQIVKNILFKNKRK